MLYQMYRRLQNANILSDPLNASHAVDCMSHVPDAWAALDAHVRSGDVVVVANAIHRFWWNEAAGLDVLGALRENNAFLTRLNDAIIRPRGASLVVIDDVAVGPLIEAAVCVELSGRVAVQVPWKTSS